MVGLLDTTEEMLMRSIKVRPSNMRRDDVLGNDSVVANVSRVGDAGTVIMFNGPALTFVVSEPSNDPVSVRRPGWQSVSGSQLVVGDRLRSGYKTFIVTSFEPREGWVAVVLDWGPSFRLEQLQRYTVWR